LQGARHLAADILQVSGFRRSEKERRYSLIRKSNYYFWKKETIRKWRKTLH
jgi:hypothetical protein